MRSIDAVRDAEAVIEVDLTKQVTFQEEPEAAQLFLDYGQALTPLQIRLVSRNASVTINLEDRHIDMLDDFIYNIRKIQDEGGSQQ